LSRKAILKSSSLLVGYSMLSRVLGLIRESVKAAFLGTTALSDAFTVAFLIPNLLRRLFAEGTTSAAFIPTLKGYLSKNNKKETAEFLSAALTFSVTIFTLTVIAGIFTSGIFVNIFGPEFDTQTADEAVFLTQIMFPYLGFISVAAFIQGILNSAGIFGPSGFTSVLFNLAFIAAAFVLSPFTANPARAISIGVTIGGMIQMGFQIPYLLKTGMRFSFSNFRTAFTHPGVKKVMRLISPTLLGMGAYQINIIATTRIANKAGEGVVSSLQFSNRLEELILGVFVISLSTVILPEFSTDAKEGRWDNFNKNLVFGIKLTAMISLPAMVFTLLMRNEIVSLLFKFGKFDDESVRITAYALMFHISGLFFIAVTRILFPAFYAQEDTVSPTIAGVVSVIVNIIAALMLVDSMKGGGVALASTISAFVSTVLLVLMLKKGGKIDLKGITNAFIYSFRFFIISAVCILPVFFLKKGIYNIFGKYTVFKGLWNRIVTELIPFSVITVIFGVTLFTVLIVIKDENVTYLSDKIARKLKWKK